jgi:hypothetical protein
MFVAVAVVVVGRSPIPAKARRLAGKHVPAAEFD